MKRFIVTILAVFYLGVSSGATVHFHYCMGRLIEWGLISKSEKCSKCGMKSGTAKKCCKKENKQLKVDSVQKASFSSFQFKSLSSGLSINAVPVLPEMYVSSLTEEYPITNAPPCLDNTPVYLRNQNFRI